MSDLNSFQLKGRLTADPVLTTTTTDKKLCKFTIANNAFYGGNDQVSFFNCTAWQKTAESISQYFKKGSSIIIWGRAIQQKWEDKSGAKRSAINFNVEGFNFCDSKKQDENHSVDTNKMVPPTPFDEEIPF